jgi:hypothetical protein
VVIASEGQTPEGRNQLRAAIVDPRLEGVELESAPAAPFVPEIPHARVRFRDVALGDDALLAGDGYSDYLKPFRTIEDCHVHAALLGHLMQLARRAGADQRLLQRMSAMVVTARALATAEPARPEVHVALAGAMARVAELVEEVVPSWWPALEPATRERWQRDQPLLEVASKARHRRIEVAWRRLRE